MIKKLKISHEATKLDQKAKKDREIDAKKGMKHQNREGFFSLHIATHRGKCWF